MEENKNNITNPDISGLFSTYKTSPTGNEKNAPEDSTVSTINNPVLPKIYQDNILSIKKWSTFFEKGMFIFQILSLRIVKIFQILVDCFLKITKIALWGIAIFGALFIAALATNTMDRAVDIINSSLLTKWWKHIAISPENSSEYEVVIGMEKTPEPVTAGLTSSILEGSPSATSDALASKRRAILEARKAAKLLEEKQKTLEQLP